MIVGRILCNTPPFNGNMQSSLTYSLNLDKLISCRQLRCHSTPHKESRHTRIHIKFLAIMFKLIVLVAALVAASEVCESSMFDEIAYFTPDNMEAGLFSTKHKGSFSSGQIKEQ